MAEIIKETAPELVEVDINSVSLKLPKEDAEKVRRWRDDHREQLRSANENLGRIKAAAEAADAKAQRAIDDKAAIEAAKKGEVDQARELLTKDFKTREDRMASRLKADAVRGLLAANAGVMPSSIPDAAALLGSRVRYNLESGEIEVLTADGSSVEKGTDGNVVKAESWLASWLKERPHFMRDTTAKGSGGGKTLPAGSGQKMTSEEWEKLEPVARGKFFADGGSLI